MGGSESFSRHPCVPGARSFSPATRSLRAAGQAEPECLGPPVPLPRVAASEASDRARGQGIAPEPERRWSGEKKAKPSAAARWPPHPEPAAVSGQAGMIHFWPKAPSRGRAGVAAGGCGKGWRAAGPGRPGPSSPRALGSLFVPGSRAGAPAARARARAHLYWSNLA